MSETQTVTKSSSSSIPANLQTLKLYAFCVINDKFWIRNLKSPTTISLISSTSMLPPPSVSNAVKIQLSLSSGVLSLFTLLA